MVITEHATNMDPDKLASVLKCPPSSSNDDRLSVYKTLANILRIEDDNDATPDFIRNCKQAVNLALTDTCDTFPELSQVSLHFLGLCIHSRIIVDSLSEKECENIIQGLCKSILHTENKSLCTRALWCLSNQIVHSEVLSSQLSSIIDSLDYSFSKPLSQSVLVEHEAVNVVIRLLQQIPKKMQEKASSWSHHVYGLLGHGAVKVREKALQALTLALPALLQNPNGLIPTMVTDVKTRMANELKKLFNNRNEVYVLRVWSLLVQLLGKELHCGFINQLLPIVELGFKSSIPNIKYEAFCAWKYLIENFASNPAIIGDQKRIKLLMQVFKINNAKTESVAMKKLEVWWYFVKKLDIKILSNFDMVCTPLLRFCVGGKWTQGSRNTPTPKLVNTPLPSQGTVWPSFGTLQKKGLEIIAHLLKLPPGNVNLPAVDLELDTLNTNVVLGPALFLKQSSVIAYATVELMCSVEASDDLVLYIWCLLVEHMRLGLEAGLKVDCRDALSSFLCDFSTLVLSRQSPYSVKYKLFLAVSKLPKKILSSTAYNISSGEKIHGTPALFLTELLLTPSMLEEGIYQENYETLFSNLIEMGMTNPSGALEFCQAVIQVLDRHAGFVQHSEQLFKLWSCIAWPLFEHITKNNEVNQGDALEHNFTSLYRALFFPVKWLFGNSLSQINMKNLLKVWGNMYRTFANLAALVVNASANVTCEHVSLLILEELPKLEGCLEDLVFVECLAQLCEVVLSCVNFSSIGENSAFTLSSPGKWGGKRKQKPLKNLHSFVTLLATVTSACHKQMNVTENNNNNTTISEKQSTSTTVQSAGKCLVGILTTLFTSITTSSYVVPVLEKCAGPVSCLFAVSKKANNKIYPASFLPKIDKLWQDIIYCSQNIYTGAYDSDFLSIMAPLLEVNFMHTRRTIKTQTLQFWNATFGQSPSLTYPESLRLVLSKVKEKVVIMLPSWISTEIQIIEETPTSQFSEASSQVADEIPIPIMLSPSKMHGSMLKNVAAPSPPTSLVKPKPVKDYAACKKLPISELKDKDFVVINSPQNKCRILTQHQQEVLREKKFSVPAMYNSLDQSQDSVAFSNSINSNQPTSRSVSDDTFTEALENKKSNVENAVKSKKKVNFLDQYNKMNIITNTFSKQDLVKEFALTAQENITIKSKIQKDMITKILQNPDNIQSIKTKETKTLTSPAKIKNLQDSTPLQNWLSTSHTKSCATSKNSLSLEPYMSSLIEDSVSPFDSPTLNKVSQSINQPAEVVSQKKFTFVEETQSPIKISPDKKVSSESILETPVKAPIKEINHDLVNTRHLSFDDLEEIATKSSESPTQEDMSPCESVVEPFTAVNSKPDCLQVTVNESEPFDNSLQNVLLLSNSDTVNCKTLQKDNEEPLADDIPMDADLHEESISKDNAQIGRGSQKRKISTLPHAPMAKRIKMSFDMDDNSDEVVKSLTSSDDSKIHSNDSHEENSPPRKRLTGSRKRKPLKVTKLIPTSPNRRISPVKTRSWGKVLRTHRKAVQAADVKERRSNSKKCKKAKKSSEITNPTLNVTKKVNTDPVTVNGVLVSSLDKSTQSRNSDECLPIKMDLDLKQQKSEETVDSIDESIVEENSLILSDHNSLQTESLDSSQDVSLKSETASDSAVEEKTVGDCNQDSVSSNTSSDLSVKKENFCSNSLMTETPKKSLRLRSGTRGFPSKFSDSFVYGIKISTSPTSSAKKNPAQKSVTKTSPQKSEQLPPKDNLINNKVESSDLIQPVTNENVVVDKEKQSTNKEHVSKETFDCNDQVKLNNDMQPVEDFTVVNEKADLTNDMQSVPATDSLPSEIETNNTDKNGIESNGDEPEVIKDNVVSNKVESTMVKSITDEKDTAICDKTNLNDTVQPVATKDCAMSDTEIVVQSLQTEDSSVSNKSMPDNIVALVATPSTKPPAAACDTPDNVPPHSYSPSPVYSPTTGILKKRLVNGSGETPSPPSKQRRVSFADPIFEEKTLPSPVSQKRRLTPGSSKSSRRSLLTNYKKRDSSNSSNLCMSNSPNSSQSSYSSSQESQLNCTDPIFPDLVYCQEPVGQILPQLTSSIWSRGLGQLLRAKKIHTIGDLASLSEYDIHNLPVRSPKVSNVKTVLTNFKQQQDAKKKCANTSISEIMAAVATAHTSANTASCELNLQSIKEKVNRKCIVAVIENPKTKSPENMGISPTAATDQPVSEENPTTAEKESFLQEMPELDTTSSSLKSDTDESTLSALEHEESAIPKNISNNPQISDVAQSTNLVSAEICDNLSTADLAPPPPVFETPEASSTPVKPATETKESESNLTDKDESSGLAVENSNSGDLPCSIKPICLEKKFSAIDCNVKDETEEQKDLIAVDDEDEDKGDYCTVEDDVKSILENSGALLEEVEKFSQSVQELERSPRSPKFIRKEYKDPESPELQSTQGFDVNHLLSNMAAESNTKNVLSSVNSAVQKDLELLPTLKDLSTKFTENEIRELAGEEIQEAHECLQQLFTSVMKAVIPNAKRKY